MKKKINRLSKPTRDTISEKPLLDPFKLPKHALHQWSWTHCNIERAPLNHERRIGRIYRFWVHCPFSLKNILNRWAQEHWSVQILSGFRLVCMRVLKTTSDWVYETGALFWFPAAFFLLSNRGLFKASGLVSGWDSFGVDILFVVNRGYLRFMSNLFIVCVCVYSIYK